MAYLLRSSNPESQCVVYEHQHDRLLGGSLSEKRLRERASAAVLTDALEVLPYNSQTLGRAPPPREKEPSATFAVDALAASEGLDRLHMARKLLEMSVEERDALLGRFARSFYVCTE